MQTHHSIRFSSVAQRPTKSDAAAAALISNNYPCPPHSREKSAAELFKETLDNQSRRLKEIQVRLAESEKTNGELAGKLTDTSARNALLVAEMETMKREKEKAMKEYAEEIRMMNVLLNEERQKGTSAKVLQEKAEASLSEKKTKIQTVEKEKEDLQKSLTETNEVVESLQREKTNLQAEKREAAIDREKMETIQSSLYQEIDQRKVEKQNLEERIAVLESELDDLFASTRSFGEWMGEAVARSRIPKFMRGLNDGFSLELRLVIPDSSSSSSSHSSGTSSQSKSDEDNNLDRKRRRGE